MPTVIIYWSPGRSDEQKAQVAQKITDTLVADGGASLEDVLIIFQRIEAGDVARQGKMIGKSADASPPNASLSSRSDSNG